MMIKKHMDEAPIIEAFDQGRGCPLCIIRDDCERQFVSSALGAGVMEPSRRIETNEKGFCERHLKMLYDSGDRLPLALTLDTHLDEVIKYVKDSGPKGGLFAKSKQKPFHSCAVCDRLEDSMSRYESTLVYMYIHDDRFKETLRNSKGVCLEHYERLLEIAPKDFCRDLREVTLKNLENIKSDVHWYALKFDWRNRDKPWGQSVDSIYRAIGILRGNRNINEPKDQQ